MYAKVTVVYTIMLRLLYNISPLIKFLHQNINIARYYTTTSLMCSEKVAETTCDVPYIGKV